MSMRDEHSSSKKQPSSNDGLSDGSSDGASSSQQPVDDATYVRKLLETLSVEDPTVFNELMMSNAQLADEFHRADPQIDRIRDALTEEMETADSGSSEYAKIVTQIKERLTAGKDAILPVRGSALDQENDAGILTDVTRQLSADQARKLFAKLAPMLVYTTLRHMNCDSSFAEVDRIAAHLCRDDVQVKLREAEHTRDALVDELSIALELRDAGERLTRDQMTQLLEESGAIADLMAMSNCITLAQNQAG